MKEELWLKKMKERLDDYSEPLPSDGWERLEKALQPSPVRMKRTIFFRRWTVAAAVALLLVVSSVGVWLLQSPVADEIRNTSMPALAVVPDELPEPAVQEKQTEMPEPVYYNKGRKARAKNLVAQQIDLRDNLEETVLKEEDSHPQPVASEEKAENKKRIYRSFYALDFKQTKEIVYEILAEEMEETTRKRKKNCYNIF